MVIKRRQIQQQLFMDIRHQLVMVTRDQIQDRFESKLSARLMKHIENALYHGLEVGIFGHLGGDVW